VFGLCGNPAAPSQRLPLERLPARIADPDADHLCRRAAGGRDDLALHRCKAFVDEAGDQVSIEFIGEHEKVLDDAVRMLASSASARRCSLLSLSSRGGCHPAPAWGSATSRSSRKRSRRKPRQGSPTPRAAEPQPAAQPEQTAKRVKKPRKINRKLTNENPRRLMTGRVQNSMDLTLHRQMMIRQHPSPRL
jgi:hypothetical protein